MLRHSERTEEMTEAARETSAGGRETASDAAKDTEGTEFCSGAW